LRAARATVIFAARCAAAAPNQRKTPANEPSGPFAVQKKLFERQKKRLSCYIRPPPVTLGRM